MDRQPHFPRLTYFLTAPFALLSVVAYLRFREPRLHRTEETVSLRRQVAITYRVLTRGRRLLPVVALAVLTSLISTTVFEFGPLWLVALAVPAVVFGPYWAGLMSSLGLGGLLAGRLPLDKPLARTVAGGVAILSAVTLTTGAGPTVVMAAQVALVLVIIVASIHATGWMITVVTLLTVVLWVSVSVRQRRSAAEAVPAVPASVVIPATAGALS